MLEFRREKDIADNKDICRWRSSSEKLSNKCLLDEGLQITAETLEMEKMLFGEPTKTEQ